MSIIRVARRNRFTTIDRETLNDARLSFRARGVLAWFLDKPDDWESDSESVARAGKEGRDAIRAAFRELKACGYMRQERLRQDNGQFTTVTFVYERPQEPEDETAGQAEDWESGGGQPGDGNPGCNPQETDTENPTASAAPPPVDVQAVFDAWIESTGRSGRTKLDRKRHRKIANALELGYPVDELIDAVRGWRHSAHHRGENDRQTVYNDLELLLRDAGQIEKFRDLERSGDDRRPPPPARDEPGPARPRELERCPVCDQLLIDCDCEDVPHGT